MTMATAALKSHDLATDDWQAIFDPDVRIIIDPAGPQLSPAQAHKMLQAAPFGYSVSGRPEDLLAQLPTLPPCLGASIVSLAERFSALMRCETVRVRLEGITGNACRKVHADYTDLRLICTLVGLGTQYTPGDDPAGRLKRIPTGAVALFKGRQFGPGHAACLHRSPPIEGTGARRLVLVIDTPQRPIPG